MNNPTISVIVPVYNTEKYLRRCIDSILAQTFTDFELLLIDDGSTDASGSICDEYLNKDERIRVFHKKNSGVSASRNLGLSQSTGMWIIFIDSDDYYLSNDSYNFLINTANEKEVDIIRGEYIAVNDQEENLFESKLNRKRLKTANRIQNCSEFLKYSIRGEFFFPLCLIKRICIGETKQREDQRFLEDMDFFARILLKNELKCFYTPFHFYAYRKITTSASNKPNKRNVIDSFNMCDRFAKYAIDASDKKLAKIYHKYSVVFYKWSLETLSLDQYYPLKDEIIHSCCLEGIRKKSLMRLWKYCPLSQHFVYYFSPTTGIKIFKQYNSIKAIIRSIIK